MKHKLARWPLLAFPVLLIEVLTLGGCPGSVTKPTYRHVKTAEVSWPTDPSFQNCWQDSSKRFGTSIFLHRGGEPVPSTSTCEADGTYLPLNGDPDMVLTALIPRANAPSGAPAMRLGVTSLVEVSNELLGPTALLPQVSGNPPIECDLDATQADWVRQHGVPQSLIDAMHKTARDVGWQPMDPGGTGTYGRPTVVDAGPHFP